MPDHYVKVLHLLRDNPNATKPQMVKELHVGKSTIDKAMEHLKNKGLIERVGSNKFGYWKAKDESFGNWMGKNEYHHRIVALERIPIVDRIYKCIWIPWCSNEGVPFYPLHRKSYRPIKNQLHSFDRIWDVFLGVTRTCGGDSSHHDCRWGRPWNGRVQSARYLGEERKSMILADEKRKGY